MKLNWGAYLVPIPRFALLLILSSPAFAGPEVPPPRAISFIENQGQWAGPAGFISRGGTVTVAIDPHSFSLRLLGPSGNAARSAMVRLTFENTTRSASLEGCDRLRTVYNFFRGSDPCRWRSGVPGYRGVRSRSLYPEVDFEVHGAPDGISRDIEYDLLLKPGADLGQVVVRAEGIHDLWVDADGSLILATEVGILRQPRPTAWQVSPQGEYREVRIRYALRGASRFGFEAEGMDPALPLTIDPILEWVVFEGGGGNEEGMALRIDGNGDIVLAGSTISFDFPATPGAVQNALEGLFDGFVARLDGETHEWKETTFLGGVFEERVASLALDSAGNVFVCGYTASEEFPVTNDTIYHGIPGDPATVDGFIAGLSPFLDQLLFSTYVGGPKVDVALNLEVGVRLPSGRMGIALYGFTESATFPTTSGAYQEEFGGGDDDFFISTLEPEAGASLQAQLSYSTFLGGAGRESPIPLDGSLLSRILARGFAVHPDGSIIIAGGTRSAGYPVTEGAFHGPPVPGDGNDAQMVVSRIRPDGRLPREEQLIYSTVIGSDVDSERALGVALDPDGSGSIWISGFAYSLDFPTTPGAFRRSNAGPGVTDAILVHLVPDGSLAPEAQLLYSSYLGGSGVEYPYAPPVVFPDTGRVAISGTTESTEFPVTAQAHQPSFAGGRDNFVAVIDPKQTGEEQLIYSSFFGGSGYEEVWASGRRGRSNLLIGGITTSGSLAPDLIFHGGWDAFLASFDLRFPVAAFNLNAPDPEGKVVVDAGPSSTPAGTHLTGFHWDFGDGAVAEGVTAEHVYASPGRYAVTLTVTNDQGLVAKKSQLVTVPGSAGDVSPWRSADLGAPAFPGGARRVIDQGASCIRLFAGGDNLTGPDDQGQFVYQEFTGDFVIETEAREFSPGVPQAFAGLMLREDLSKGSRHASLLLEDFQGGKFSFFRRETSDKPVKPPHRSAETFQLPARLQLERTGDTVIARWSNLGEDAWHELDRVTFADPLPPLPSRIFGGIVGCGRDPGQGLAFRALEALFCVKGDAPSVVRFRRGDVDGNGAVDLTDAIGLLGNLFLGEGSPGCADAEDADDSGGLDLTDAIGILGYLFLGTGVLPPPGAESCGEDPTADALPGCAYDPAHC
jgi:hypothetical protein